jgi:CheY-like chemotaxis protein
LSQVYGFVRQSGGHVRIYSELRHGTTIKIYLPRLAEDGESAVETKDEIGVGLALGHGETVLIVEDQDELRAFAAEALNELGYRVLEARDAPGALKRVETESDIDLLFTDVVLPGGMNGRALAEEVVRRSPQTVVLFTTGYARNAIVHQGRLDPRVNLIGKPFSYTQLADKVRRLLDSRARTS